MCKLPFRVQLQYGKISLTSKFLHSRRDWRDWQLSGMGVKCILASLLFTFVFILNSTIDIWNLIWRKSQISPEPCQQCWLSGWKIARPQPASPTESIFYSIVCKNTVCKKYKIQFAKVQPFQLKASSFYIHSCAGRNRNSSKYWASNLAHFALLGKY